MLKIKKFIDNLKQFIQFIMRIIVRIIEKIKFLVMRLLNNNSHIVLGRVACLGKDIFNLRKDKYNNALLINQQKTRVDLMCEWINGKERPKTKEIKRFISRTDIYPLIKEQESLWWLKLKNCDYILMDSFSELTDQKFSHRHEGWSFCCHYSDIKHTPEFEALFENNGLLPIDELANSYQKFFELINLRFPDKHIIFIHFPTLLDQRKVYKERGAKILRVMKEIESKNPNITNIYIDDDKVEWNEGDKFPYHYSKQTNAAILNQWKKKITC